jgi:tetratricopeptide (TPR) repeat protein
MRGIWAAALLGVAAMCVTGGAQTDRAAQANELYLAGKRVDALPLYQDLAKSYPNEMLYQERLAGCLGAAAMQATDPAQVNALRTQERDAARRAIALGDKANYIQVMANLNPDAPVEIAPQSAGGAALQQGEKAFDRGDYQTAMASYIAAAGADPHLYEAPLYAGDTAYAQDDLATAAHWFARAIEVNQNRETAYRYWGDAILKFGNDPDAAKSKYIDAIVAEPYNKFAWQGLEQWAQIEKGVLLPPRIERPASPEIDAKNPKNITINVNPADAGNEGAFAWMAYSMKRVLFRNDEFAKDFPDEKTYRHTLKEEDEALSTVVSVLRERKIPRDKLDESQRNLLDVSDAGMLDCWILINGADEGIALDYAAYRDGHRQLLHDYIAHFVVHGGVRGQ